MTAQTNAERAKAYRERKKSAQLSAQTKLSDVAVELDVTGGGASSSPAGIAVEVKAQPPQKPSLRERLGLGGAPGSVPNVVKKATKGKQVTGQNLVSSLLPTILASIVVTWARDRIPEEYQACAPTKNEVDSIIGPPMDIIGRRITVAAEVSQDLVDLTNALVCGMAYGARAYVTYVQIKKQKESEQHGQQPITSSERDSYAGGLRAYQGQSNGTDRAPVGVPGGGPGQPVNGPAGNGAYHRVDDPEPPGAEAAAISDLFKRDIEGRRHLGLLPRTV